MNMKQSHNLKLAIAIAAVLAGNLQAQQIEEIVVSGNPIGSLGLDQESETGSRLAFH